LKFKNLNSNLKDSELIEYLKIYYSHIVNGVSFVTKNQQKYKNIICFMFKIDLRFQNSLRQDSDLRINVRLANVLVYPVSYTQEIS
jgi:hypothetical protein